MDKHLEITFLSNKQVDALGGADMKEIIHDVERVLSLMDDNQVINAGKCVMRWGNRVEDEAIHGRINAMPGYVGGEYEMAGLKWIGSNPQNHKIGFPRATVLLILNDPVTKIPVAVADGTVISAKRTGAAGGLAAEYLTRKGASVMTIIGTGVQAWTQLEAILLTTPSIKDVYVQDIVPERAKAFALDTSKLYGLNVTAVKDPEDYCKKSDIIVTVTIANDPIVHSSWIKKGALMMNMADFEFTYDCVRIADKIVVDTWEGIKHRKISTVSLMYHEGFFKDEEVTAHLGEIINGKKKGRETDEEIIYFNAVGMGIEDIAVITRVYKNALQQGVGYKVPYWETEQPPVDG